MELAIYNRQGTLKRKVSPDSSSRWTEEVGTEFVVTVNFTTWEFFVLSVGDYVEISGKRFSIKKEYRPKKTDTQKYTYNISFYGREHDMQDLLFCRLNQGEDDLESVFAYDGTPMEMLEKLVANMNRNTDGVTWRAGQAVTGDRKTINFNGLFCWDAAGEIAGAWETEWWLDGEYLNIGKCEHGERVTLGYMKGLKTGLTQNENSNSIKWFTRLIPVGSTKNIDPSKYGYTHLQLPSRDKYIDLNTQLGLKEHREEAAFEDIFPHRLGTVSSVRSEEQTNTDGEEYTVYYIKDKDLPFNPDEYMIGEEVIHITFESGDLSGREFECNWHNGTQEFEIINTYPDDNTQIPGGNIIPQAGDTYILTNIRMPDEYYPIAEEQYKQAVDSFLTEYSKDISIYSGDTDYIHVDKNSVPLSLGQRVRLEDAQYFEAGYIATRITRIERKLGNLSEASIDCSSAVSTSWKSSVDSTLNNLEYTLAQELAQTFIRLLKMGDTEAPSDYTAYSSLRSRNEFISKRNPDAANELITFLKGLLIGKNGSGITVLEDGTSQAVVDRLYVKIKAVFDELEVKKKTHVGGEQILSPAGMKCVRVEELDESYRCFFLSEVDGITINNEFTVGTLALAQEFNIKEGTSHNVSNRYYWREVTGVGSDYIDLSKTNADKDSDIPVAGDDIIGLGHLTDITRQAAIILSSVNETSPSIIFYQGINSFSLAGKEVIGLGFDKSTGHAYINVYGDAYIGAKDESTYIRYTQKGGVDIKGMFHIEQGSTGWKNMEGLPDEIQAAADLAQKAQDAIDNAAVGSVNLLRNSGFTGNYSPADLNFNTELSAKSEVYSDKLNYWSNSGASVIKDTSAVSGYSVTIGSISQVVNALIPDENYVVSFKAKGENVTVTCGGWNTQQPLTSSFQKFVFKFTFNGAKSLALAGACTLCDIQLERGTIATDWAPNPLDRDDFYSTFLALKYLTDYMKDGSVDILGGLILAGAILLGNYKDGSMQEVTAGISGTYNDGDDVSFFSGGNLEKAIRTVMKYKDDPGYVPSEDELKMMANFVITHGGRAILNDVVLRGYVHALGGFFRGRLETSVEGKRIVIDPEKNTLEMYTTEGHATLVMRFDTSSDGWEYGDLILRKYVGDQLIQETTVYPERIRIQNHVENTDIILNPNNVSFYGSNGDMLLVGMKPIYDGVSVSRYVANIECSSWPSRDNVSPGQVYVEYETVGGVVTNGTLKVRK
nr:MAG TPA: tail protein [Caudoviricetes sp.]